MDLPPVPRAGEPLKASWAQQLLTAVKSLRLHVGPGLQKSVDANGTTILLDPKIKAGATPRPFAVRIGRKAAGEIAAYVYLPPDTADAIRYADSAVPPGAGQDIGTDENPWVRLPQTTGTLWLVLNFGGSSGSSGSSSGSSDSSGSSGSSGSSATPVPSSLDRPTDWELSFDGTAGPQRHPHLVAILDEEDGVVQFHLGSMLLDGGPGDDWMADSDAKQYYSIDPPSVALQYETEEAEETVTQTYGKALDGTPLTRQVTVRKTRVKTDANGNPVVKQRQARDANGNPVVDGNGDPVMEPDTTPAQYHQVHNFDSGSDNELLELAGDDGYGGTPVACRVTDGQGFAELKWRRIPPTPAPCQPSYALSEGAASGCSEKTISLTKTEYTKDSQGRCQPGSPVVVGNPISIPKPPEYELVVSEAGCRKTVKLKKTPCGGTASYAGGTLTIAEPPTITATSTGSSASGSKAGTITVTPCSGSPQTIDVYNGRGGDPGAPGCSPDISVTVLEPGSSQGGEAGGYLITITNRQLVNGTCTDVSPVQTFIVRNGIKGGDGCSPVVSAASGTDAQGRVAVCSIQPRRLGNNGCENDGPAFIVYNGKDGDLCGSFQCFGGMKFDDNKLWFRTQTYNFQFNSTSGCYEPVATGTYSAWTEVSGLTFQVCST